MKSCPHCCRWISRLTIVVLAMLGLTIGIACATAGEESAPAPAKPDSLTIEKTRPATRRLGEVAIRMAPKGALIMNGTDVHLAAPDSSRSLQADLAEFAQLLNEGADPSAVRIAGFEPAGQRSLSGGMTLMTSGNPGHVVPPDSSGFRLYEYLKRNGLDDACRLLAAHGPLTEKDVTVFKTAFLTAAADLRQLDGTRMLQLLSPDVSAEMKRDFDAVSRLKSSLTRLKTVATEKSLVLPAGLEPDAWSYHYLGLATAQSMFESDGRAVWVFLDPIYCSFEKHLDRWKPMLPQGYASMCDNYSQFADSLRTGIATGAVTEANLQAQIKTMWQRIVTPDAIIGAGGKIDEGDESGITPLMVASGAGRMDSIQALLSRGENASIVDKQGQSAFHWAAIGGSREALDLFLERGAAIDAGNLIGQTALMLASQYGNADAVRTLLSHGARIDARDKEGRTAFMRAMEMGLADVGAVLLDAGAKIDDRDGAGMTPLMYVGRAGLPGNPSPAINPSRAIVARAGGSETEKDATGGVQMRKEESRSVAASRTTRLLLDRGADKNARDKMGNTALMHAAQDGRLIVLGLLMDSGADYRAKNMNGRSAKNLALDNGQREAAWMLRWWDPTRFEARLGGGISGISHPGQAADFEYEAGVGMSVRFNKRIGLYNGIVYAAMISDNTGSDVPSIPGVQAYNSGFFKFGTLEYRPEIRFDFPPLHSGHVYLLGGLSVGKVISASLNSSDGSTDSRDIKSVVNGSTFGWRVGAGLIGRGMSLEVSRSQNITDAFKDWSGSFGAWTLTVGYWR